MRYLAIIAALCFAAQLRADPKDAAPLAESNNATLFILRARLALALARRAR